MKFFSLRPSTQRVLKDFARNRLAFWSFMAFLLLFFLSLLSPFLANENPLLVTVNGKIYLPVFVSYPETEFGGFFETKADYRDKEVIALIEEQGGKIYWPPVPYSYNTQNKEDIHPAPPSSSNWLGTDNQGRDIVARLLYGYRISVLFGFVLSFLLCTIGILAGAVQGYYGGKTDLILQRFIEIWEGLPGFFILIIMAGIFAPSIALLFGILCLFGWPALVPMVRAEFLKTRKLQYVLAARALGVSNTRIMLRHVLPNALVSAMTFFPFMLLSSVTSLTALDFLGLGLPPGSPSLGEMMQQAQSYPDSPWIGLSVFITLSSLLVLTIMVQDGIRDAFDPQKSGQKDA